MPCRGLPIRGARRGVVPGIEECRLHHEATPTTSVKFTKLRGDYSRSSRHYANVDRGWRWNDAGTLEEHRSIVTRWERRKVTVYAGTEPPTTRQVACGHGHRPTRLSGRDRQPLKAVQPGDAGHDLVAGEGNLEGRAAAPAVQRTPGVVDDDDARRDHRSRGDRLRREHDPRPQRRLRMCGGDRLRHGLWRPGGAHCRGRRAVA